MVNNPEIMFCFIFCQTQSIWRACERQPTAHPHPSPRPIARPLKTVKKQPWICPHVHRDTCHWSRRCMGTRKGLSQQIVSDIHAYVLWKSCIRAWTNCLFIPKLNLFSCRMGTPQDTSNSILDRGSMHSSWLTLQWGQGANMWDFSSYKMIEQI